MFGFGKPDRPRAIAFDTVGTLIDLEPLRPLIAALGLPGATQVGCSTAYLSTDRPMPSVFAKPDVEAGRLPDLAERILDLEAAGA